MAWFLIDYYETARPHQGLSQRIPVPRQQLRQPSSPSVCRFQETSFFVQLALNEVFAPYGPKALDARKTELAYRLYDEKKYAIKEMCQMLGISKPTLYAYLRQRNGNAKEKGDQQE